jgi:hypothetical protein|tara:strand:- start:1268 stop:1942 length:675 start_codon:yes stop_codon:yes gene_type:complete
MKLSNYTTSVLKNFSTINQNLVIKEGNTITTMSAMKNIVAKAEVEETFPQQIAIYDLNEFLGALSLFTSPVLDFSDNYVMISEENKPTTKMKYFYSDPSVVTSPNKMITMPSNEVKFTMSSEDLSRLKRAAGAIGAPDMVLEKDGSSSSLTVKDKKNDTANNYSLDVDTTSEGEFNFYFKVENMKLLDGNYDVEISAKNISHYTNKSTDIEYWIALEPESTYTV